MKRQIALLAAGFGITAAAFAAAPAAHATDITNPAENPAPITVTVDGQQYTDGQDTLPGEDDYACTPIPGVTYDFADNEIIYHTDNGTKTVHWTEWDRITSYQVWLKQQSASSTKTTTATTSSSSSTKSSTTSSTSSSKSSSTKSSSTKKSSSKSTTSKASASADPSASASADPSASASVDPSASASASASASVSAAPKHHKKKDATAAAAAAVPSPSSSTSTVTADTQLSSAVTSSIGHGSGNTRLAGVVILGGFAAVSLALLLGNAVRTAVGRRRGGVA